MSAIIPLAVSKSELHSHLTGRKLPRCHQGKVRDTYALPDDQLLLIVATDRVSIFDFVLPFYIPFKGELLTALTVFWFDEVLLSTNHHLVAYGKGIDKYLPKSLRGYEELYLRALVVRKQDMVPVECIVRGYLTGSGWRSYQKTEQVCGIKLESGLQDGSRIAPDPIFTPTTKAEQGHDEHLPEEVVLKQYGDWIRDKSLEVYQQLSAVASDNGLIVADTKLEFGHGAVLADEVGTPDSSRFWDAKEWETAQAQSKSPQPFDKEVVRHWGVSNGVNKLNPEDPLDLKIIRTLKAPRAIILETRSRYDNVFKRLTHLELSEFQEKKFGVV